MNNNLTGRACAALAVGVLAGLAAETARRSSEAELSRRRSGNTLSISGVQLCYREKGMGPALVLLHGNGSMIEDFELSGLFDLAAMEYRVIAFDRPGFGQSSRPGNRTWTAEEQAKLLLLALEELGVERPIVLGHSWGTLTALALAFENPLGVSGLLLASGYYFPQKTVVALALAVPAFPVMGTLLRYTAEPFLARLLWRQIERKLFSPAPVPDGFRRFPVEMALRPSQLKATAEETGLLNSTVTRFRTRYEQLSVPVMVMAGKEDGLVDPMQSVQLHQLLPAGTLRLVPGTGHMIHHTATSEVMEGIRQLASVTSKRLPANSILEGGDLAAV